MKPRLVFLPYLLFLCALGACSRAPAPDDAAAALLEHDGRVAWQGMLACADCDGIDTSLSLDRRGGQRDYLLIESYLTEGGAERFVERGRWQANDDALIRLRAIDGGERVYALQADGRLQPRDTKGRRFATRDGDFLMPAMASSGQ
ncbi:NlpE-like protein [Luteimonas cucumeris]|uniref:NlpE-like protein n=1 Tax=Luteimonas cucumeris TaxID=985012 RepID=A0A562L2Y4_9GAMM|nr:copper resistance protein NlpE N-terminal domain-containing protein [Luteimonas cucumeris]TWI01886.1 NlpE-like protein [Luteimonas cucumeris]